MAKRAGKPKERRTSRYQEKKKLGIVPVPYSSLLRAWQSAHTAAMKNGNFREANALGAELARRAGCDVPFARPMAA